MIRYDDNDTLLVIEYRNTHDISILERLIKQYTDYITGVQNKLYSKYGYRYSLDDFRQIIVLAFINIVKVKYNPKKGVKFRTYLMNCLSLDTLQIIRDDKWYLAPRSERLQCNNIQGFADCIVSGEGLSDFEKEDIVITGNKSNDYSVTIDYRMVLNSMKELLTKEQYIIIYNVLILEKPYSVIANALNISKNRVSKQYKIALNILREYWNR